jgi:hypothetical protein
VGTDTVTATYSGDPTHAVSTGSASVTISKDATTTSDSVAPATADLGTPVAYSAAVSSAVGTPTGTVAFTVGSTSLCTATLSGGSGTCTSNLAPFGSDTVRATYEGATDYAGSSGTTPLTITEPPLTVANLSLPASTVGATYTFGLNPSGGTPPYSWSITAGALPGGLTLSSVGLISGTVETYGTAAFTVEVTDAAGQHATRALSIDVGPSTLTVTAPVVGMASTPDGGGYWIVDAAGGIAPRGDAGFYGSFAGKPLNAPISHIVATPDGKGYWLVASEGGIFTFGDAHFYGSMGGKHLNAPVVGLATTPDGKGYWLVASDGGIFTFGDAAFHGSTGALHLNKPVVGMAADPATGGYWLVAADGGVFSFDAPFRGAGG